MIDSTIVREHACATGYGKKKEGLGRSKGGFTSKIHALVDALENPLKFIIKEEDLMEDIKGTTVIADKGYDSKIFRNHLDNNVK
ncbi:MAG: hypothetical protein P857_888 [Candidatus Xenolissoclinum pacificiensis L6]|uniref:Transposase n=1 Tax=Candidatus Xenolissoclinum pacificiensis L6 TaxID=1401685 RepID=W2UZZ5_9RICK|nr:MAG: hypothetical protein P857_888 [Candidatus Xenolissoclinum pacificiensis L6]